MNAEEPDLARGARVRARTKFHGITIELGGVTADLDHAHDLPVFVAEELHDVPPPAHLRVRHLRPGDTGIFDDAFIYESLDVAHLRGRERGAVEVEGELVGADKGAFLRGLLAHDFVQGPVQQMGHGVMPLDGRAAFAVELDGHVFADGRPVAFLEEMEPGIPALLRVNDPPGIPAVPRHFARIADLPTHRGVADGIVGHDHRLAFHRQDFLHIRAGMIVVVTNEMRGSLRFDFGEFDDLFLLRRPCAGFLLLHQFVAS